VKTTIPIPEVLMSTPTPYNNTTRTSLVIVFPPGVSGLFNPDVHGLVRQVQEELPGVYVSYALASGSAPTLRDAVAAARFAGCQSSVVVFAGENDDTWLADAKSKGDWLLASSSVPAEIDATAVVEAFNAVVVDADQAA
jgi:hypothetical protein